MRSPGKFLVDVVSKIYREVIKVARQLGNTVQPVIGLFLHRAATEIVFQPLHPDTGARRHKGRVIAVRERPKFHPELYLRDLTDGMRSPGKFLVDVHTFSCFRITIEKLSKILAAFLRTEKHKRICVDDGGPRGSEHFKTKPPVSWRRLATSSRR